MLYAQPHASVAHRVATRHKHASMKMLMRWKVAEVFSVLNSIRVEREQPYKERCSVKYICPSRSIRCNLLVRLFPHQSASTVTSFFLFLVSSLRGAKFWNGDTPFAKTMESSSENQTIPMFSASMVVTGNMHPACKNM